VGTYCLHDRLADQQHRDFLETVLPGLLEDVPLDVRQNLWFQRDGAPAHCVRDAQQWLNETSRKVDWTSRAECTASLVSGSNSVDYFLWGVLGSTFMQSLPGLSKIL
jgi:hypothetical protein